MSSKRLVDLDPFAAALARKERAKREAQAAEATVAPHATLAQPATVVRHATVARHDTEPLHGATVAQPATVVRPATVARYAMVETEFTSVPNDVWDEVMPTLNVYDQVVLWRLYRLARGYHSETCMVGLEKLAKSCNIGKRQVSTSIERLEKTGLVERTGTDFGNKNKLMRGTVYKVNIPAARVAPQARVAQPATLAQQTTVAQYATIKHNTLKENTQTQEDPNSVGVCSVFSIEECRRFAEHLRSTGQGITNPGGYATKVHRTGEADEMIKSFLAQASTPASKSVDASSCPDCNGTGWWYPQGQEMGIAKCKHERLAPKAEK